MIEGTSGAEDHVRAAGALLQFAEKRGATLVVTESLTGGQAVSSLVEVPSTSRVLAGTVVAYATWIKVQALGVDIVHLELTGPVGRDVTLQMAYGVCRLFGADLELATTGVAESGPADRRPIGAVHIIVVTPWGQGHRELHLSDDRSRIRCATVVEVCELTIGFLQKNECGPQP